MRPAVIVILVSISIARAQDHDPRATALANFKTALETGNVKTLANLAAGKEGDVLRKLADPYTKTKAASDRLDAALKEKGINFTNPFAGSVTPLADLQLDILEIAKDGNQDIARVRFGPRGKAMEETLALVQEEGTWRISLPAELLKDLRTLSKKDHRDRRLQGIDKLGDLLDTVAKEVQNGTLKTKEAVVLRVARLFQEGRLGELLG
jgi:hypothetical protein